MLHVLWRIARAGVIVALFVAVAGWTVERVRFGASDEDSIAAVEAELRQRFDTSANTLGTIAAQIVAERDVVRAAPRDQAALRQLFETVERALPDEDAGRAGITVYDKD